jgi:hypothetical protein
MPTFFVLGYVIAAFNVSNYEIRDDALLNSSQLNTSIGLGILAIILAYNSEFIMKNRFHFVMGLLFLIAIPSLFMNIGISTIALSN